MESSLAWHPTGFYTFGSQNSENAASLQLGVLELDITHLQQFIITLCVSLAAYAILAKLCWLQLRVPSDHYDWYPIVVSFLFIQLFAIAKEVGRCWNPEFGAQQLKIGYLAHKVFHHVCLGITSYLIGWRLETSTVDVDWTVIFSPMFVDVVFGIVILWYTCPNAAAEDNFRFGTELRVKVFCVAFFHFLAWGLGLLLLGLKLDKVLKCPWHSALIIWTLLLVMLGIKMLVMSLKFGFYPLLIIVRSSTPFSCAAIPALGAAFAIVLSWFWVIVGYTTWIAFLGYLKDYEREVSKDPTKRFFDVIKQPDDVDSLFWPVFTLLLCTIIIIPALLRILQVYASVRVTTIMRYKLQGNLSLDDLTSPMFIRRASTSKFEVVYDNPSEQELEDLETGKSIALHAAAEQYDSEEVHHENNIQEEQRVCCVCLTVEQPNALLLDCMHVCSCYDCAKAVIQNGDQHCPICRANVKMVLRIPDEVLNLAGEGIGRIFVVTEGIVVNQVRNYYTYFP